ncbi:MAG: OmpA family protein, partial [Bacteroidota bacterium]
DGNVLLMSVEREDGLGDLDLFVSFKLKGNNWTEPINLGPQINTVGSESSIFIAADNRTIYFASNGHPGYGGFDMFMSRRLDESWTNWSTPQNMGKEINSKGNDYNYTIPASGEYAYFSRENQLFKSDLYRIKLPKAVQPEPVLLMSGNIIDAETGEPVAAKLKYEKLQQEKENETEAESDNFQVVLQYGDDVAVHAEADGYFAVSESMELSDETLEEEDFDESRPVETPEPPKKKEKNSYQEVNKDILMVPLKIGQVIPMNNIFFEANKSDLKPESKAELERVLRFLQENGKLIVEVGGHTNGWCDHEFAAKLSQARAKEVRAYFTGQGVSENRIKFRGYGKTKPIASNKTPAGRKKNQRVELTILEILN